MNETTTTKKSEFVFRRLSDSFDQFAGDLGHALIGTTVAQLLLALVVLTVVARVVYRFANPAARAPGAKDPTAHGLKVGMWVSVAALVGWVLVAFYNRDGDASRGAPETVSALGSANAIKWYAFTGAVFALGSVFVVLMYFKDTKTVRWYWAVPLALLRITVYAILCFVFLLPSMQTWEDTSKQSRMVILLDISQSVTVESDETGRGTKKLPDGRTVPKPRIDVLIELLTDEKVALLRGLLDKNPVAVYTFGSRLDESPLLVEQGAPAWSKEEWEALAKYDFKPFVLRGLSDEGKEQLKKTSDWGEKGGDENWAQLWFNKAKDPDLKTSLGLSNGDDVTQLKKNLERLDKRIELAKTIILGTNVPDSIRTALEREAPNMLQGIIVLSDGRSNLGSDSAYSELRDRAAREKVPVFTIVVGEDRQTVRIDLTEVNAPDSAPVDEPWKIVVEADGVNMANKEVEVFLDLWMPEKLQEGKTKMKDMKNVPPDHTMPAQMLKFLPGDPPHGQTEFLIDPAKLPEKLTQLSTDAAIQKRVLLDGKWCARARIKKDPQEVFKDDEHVRDRPGIDVVQKKLRVLLFGSALGREGTFLRTLLAREQQDKRATLTTYIQNEAGKHNEITPEKDEVLLNRFPNKFDLTNKTVLPEDKPYNLNEYDVIIALDPDWSELSQQQADDLARWLKEGTAGLIYVAGSIHTSQLARVEKPKAGKGGGKLLPLLEVLPVEPADDVDVKFRKLPTIPRRLYLKPERIPGMDLLKLDDKVKDDPIAGWERFFTDREKYEENPDLNVEAFPQRGFYSCYPVQHVKPNSAVLGEFVELSDTREKVTVPWLVTNNPSAPYRTVFMGSAETYRLRMYDPDIGREFFERFWVKMIKHAASKRNIKAPRGRVLVSKEAVENQPLRVQARILNESAKPYDQGRLYPKFKIVQETPGGEKKELGTFNMTEKHTAAGEFDGYYAGQELLDPKKYPAGDGSLYRVVIEVPDAPGETLSGEFRIRNSNPEKDNTRPDYVAMLRMASVYDKEFEEGRNLQPRVRNELKARLPKEGNTQRLAFKVTDKEMIALIPECIQNRHAKLQNRGPVNDLWDRGFTMPTSESESQFTQKYFISWWSGQRLSFVLLVVVGLLALEWLWRKLLRLA